LHFKGVLIDFGGTLAYLDELENRRYEEALVLTLEKYGYKRGLKDISGVLASTYVSSTKGEQKTPHEFWSLVLRKLEVPARQDLTNELEAVRNRHLSSTWKLYDGVSAALATLRKKYRLALVSNCAEGTDRLINSLGLADFFSCIILSYQVGVRKPDKRIYLETLGCLKLEAHECIFVADEISDLEGAREIGLRTMLVRQGTDTFQGAKDVNFKPKFEISQISEITTSLVLN
jgi:putative hydrolase of the HAD superfamily